MKKILNICALVCLIFFIFIGYAYCNNTPTNSALSKPAENLSQPQKDDYKDNELLVKFKAGTSKDIIGEILKKYNLKIADYASQLDFYKLNIKEGTNPKELANKLKKNERCIEEAQPNFIYRPNISFWIARTKITSSATKTSRSNNITVAVIDTGINPYHPQLKGRLVKGWDAVDFDSDPSHRWYDSGHGSWVAGTINAVSSSGVKIMPIRAGSQYFYSWDIINSIIYAADHGAKVINMSLGGAGYSSFMQYAIDYAYNKGVVIVAAAGNSNTDTKFYPAAYNHVIGVGALGPDHTSKAYFSNYGSYIDVTAPGEDIVTTSATNNGYVRVSGTSFSSPFVAGFAASLMQNKNYTNRNIERLFTKEYTKVSLISEIYGYNNTVSIFTTQDIRLTDRDIYGNPTVPLNQNSYLNQFGTITYQNTKTTFNNIVFDNKGRLSSLDRSSQVNLLDKEGNAKAISIGPTRLTFDATLTDVEKIDNRVRGFTETTYIHQDGALAFTRSVSNITYSQGLIAGYEETTYDYISNPNYLKLAKTQDVLQNTITKKAYDFQYDENKNLKKFSELVKDSSNKDFYSILVYYQTDTCLSNGNTVILKTRLMYNNTNSLVDSSVKRITNYASLKDLSITYSQIQDINPKEAEKIELPRVNILNNVEFKNEHIKPIVVPNRNFTLSYNKTYNRQKEIQRRLQLASIYSEIGRKIRFEQNMYKLSRLDYELTLDDEFKFKDN